MKRISILFIVLMLAGTSTIFSMGIGLQGNINAGEYFAPGVAISLKLDSSPLYFAFNWQFEEDIKNLSVTADYWALDKTLFSLGSEPFNLFFGLGGYCNVTIDERSGHDFFQPSLGLRIPVGVHMYLLDRSIEPFIQVSPSFGISFIPVLGAETVYWPISAGVRIWF